MEEYVLLIDNRSDNQVTVYYYRLYDTLYWISKGSTIVKPRREELYQEGSPYKYQVKVGDQLNQVFGIFLSANQR